MYTHVRSNLNYISISSNENRSLGSIAHGVFFNETSRMKNVTKLAVVYERNVMENEPNSFVVIQAVNLIFRKMDTSKSL